MRYIEVRRQQGVFYPWKQTLKWGLIAGRKPQKTGNRRKIHIDSNRFFSYLIYINFIDCMEAIGKTGWHRKQSVYFETLSDWLNVLLINLIDHSGNCSYKQDALFLPGKASTSFASAEMDFSATLFYVHILSYSLVFTQSWGTVLTNCLLNKCTLY